MSQKLKLTKGRTIALEDYGLTVTIRPETYEDLAWVQAKIEELGPTSEALRMQNAATFSLIRRITEWEGVFDPDENPAPCTMGTKSELFAQHPELSLEVFKKLRGQIEEEGKNSKPSRRGSRTTTRGCAPSAPKDSAENRPAKDVSTT